MIDSSLNLARKWQTKTFDQIAGQDLSIRILKNSLYLGHLFPVYLFSGQHGCGKTSTARIFASAINCHALEQFQKDPKLQVLPCLTCSSCVAMLAGKHLDFIEIDAASHTGVDNIRAIIDTAFLLPLNSRKKIYLIDEVHMLSKAAFNALLKILEDPPATVLFILATTDPQKILDTVKSRCFQLFFKAVEAPLLINYLHNVCNAENISCDVDGLRQIVSETRGSVRDALNIIEQVRFAAGAVTQKSVLSVLGYLDVTRMMHILTLIVAQDVQKLLIFLQEINIQNFSAELIWYRFIELIREFLLLKHGAHTHGDYSHYIAELQLIAKNCSTRRVHAMLALMYTHELVFLKTTKQHLFLEMLFLQLCELDNNDMVSGSHSNTLQVKETAIIKNVSTTDSVRNKTDTNSRASADKKISPVNNYVGRASSTHEISSASYVGGVSQISTASSETSGGNGNKISEISEISSGNSQFSVSNSESDSGVSANNRSSENTSMLKEDGIINATDQDSPVYLWQRFMQEIKACDDSLIISIFSHGRCVRFDRDLTIVHIELSKNFSFFESVLHEQRAIWLPYLKKIFSDKAQLNFIFTDVEMPVGTKAAARVDLDINSGVNVESKIEYNSSLATQKKKLKSTSDNSYENYTSTVRKTVDISDANTWKITHMILRYFPGSIHKVENENE